MPAVVVYVEESSLTEGGAPTPEAIRAALVAAAPGAGMSERARLALGAWVGPARITRGNLVPVAGVPRRITRIASVWQWPDTEAGRQEAPRIASWIAERVAGRLGEIPEMTWSHVVLKPYLPAMNGPLSWWASGAASREADYVTSWPSSGAGDNPIGPNLARADLTARIVEGMRGAAATGAIGVLFPHLVDRAESAAGGLVGKVVAGAAIVGIVLLALHRNRGT